MTNRQVLMLIAAFLILTVGSFIWYIATWDDRQAQASTSFQNINISTAGRFFDEKFSHLASHGAKT